MTIKKLLIISMLALTVAACGGGTSGGGGDNDGPITFTILLSANCDGTLNTADIFFDVRFVATLTPGGSTDIVTTRGNHRIEARGDNGGTVGPLQRDIQADGSTETLTCNG
jgi:hypothetical protein